MVTSQLDVDEEVLVYDWRLKFLRGLGCFSDVQLTDLAMSEADMHRVEDLIAAGCPVELIGEILG